MSQVCSNWFRVSRENELWKQLFAWRWQPALLTTQMDCECSPCRCHQSLTKYSKTGVVAGAVLGLNALSDAARIAKLQWFLRYKAQHVQYRNLHDAKYHMETGSVHKGTFHVNAMRTVLRVVASAQTCLMQHMIHPLAQPRWKASGSPRTRHSLRAARTMARWSYGGTYHRLCRGAIASSRLGSTHLMISGLCTSPQTQPRKHVAGRAPVASRRSGLRS